MTILSFQIDHMDYGTINNASYLFNMNILIYQKDIRVIPRGL